ncbi:MAG: RNA-binding S4 domain-containing protein [Thiobacillaceae bacterium]|jgi:ribosome-associated heat shock protein Hsp15|nr:RNA-binding S4 domain-containing protein [Thiobacillaceae bacterium]
MPDEPSRVRVDKWLWAARFFKTRSLASQAVDGGRVRLNGERPKPAREVRVGDRVRVQIGEYAWEVTVRALSDRRGPASVAQGLYVEDAASLAARQERIEQRRLAAPPGTELKGRPTKKARRQIHRFTEAG